MSNFVNGVPPYQLNGLLLFSIDSDHNKMVLGLIREEVQASGDDFTICDVKSEFQVSNQISM